MARTKTTTRNVCGSVRGYGLYLHCCSGPVINHLPCFFSLSQTNVHKQQKTNHRRRKGNGFSTSCSNVAWQPDQGDLVI